MGQAEKWPKFCPIAMTLDETKWSRATFGADVCSKTPSSDGPNPSAQRRVSLSLACVFLPVFSVPVACHNVSVGHKAVTC